MCLFCDFKVRMWYFEDKKQNWILCFFDHDGVCPDSSFSVGMLVYAGENSGYITDLFGTGAESHL